MAYSTALVKELNDGAAAQETRIASSTNTSVVPGKLVDSAKDLTAAGVNKLQVGDIVLNITDGTQANILTLDSLHQVGLDADIFKATGKSYKIISSYTVRQPRKYIDQVVNEKIAALSPLTVVSVNAFSVRGDVYALITYTT